MIKINNSVIKVLITYQFQEGLTILNHLKDFERYTYMLHEKEPLQT